MNQDDVSLCYLLFNTLHRKGTCSVTNGLTHQLVYKWCINTLSD